VLPAWIYRTSAFHYVINDYVIEFTNVQNASLQRRENLQCALINFALRWTAFGALRELKETFHQRQREFVSPRDTISFSLVIFETTCGGPRGMSAENGHTPRGKRQPWGCLIGGEGDRWGGETLNRCNSFSWAPAKPSAEHWSREIFLFFLFLLRPFYTRAIFCRVQN